MLLHQSSTQVATLDPLQPDEAEAAARIAWGCEGALPDGMSNTHGLTAWYSVVAGAIAWGDIAMGLRVNGGAICGVAVARVDPADRSRMLLMTCCSAYDADWYRPRMAAAVRDLVQRRGLSLVRRRTVTTVTYDAV
jgi:hypothetical protein